VGEQPKDDTGKANKARPKVPTGPEVLIFRDDNSTDLRDGILTYVFLDRIRSIEFDNDKRTIIIRVAKARANNDGEKSDSEGCLTGCTNSQGENKITIEAEAGLGDLGVASVKFHGGGPKGIKEIRFPTPKMPAAPKGRPAEVTAADKAKTAHAVVDLQPLYLLGGTERLVPILRFKKTVKIGLGKIKKLAFVEGGEGM